MNCFINFNVTDNCTNKEHLKNILTMLSPLQPGLPQLLHSEEDFSDWDGTG